jgi:hypothetical protein
MIGGVFSHVPMNVTPTPTVLSTAAETLVDVFDLNMIEIRIFVFSHTKELLDEALDSVKSVLMQTFKKNLESGGDLEYVQSSYI